MRLFHRCGRKCRELPLGSQKCLESFAKQLFLASILFNMRRLTLSRSWHVGCSIVHQGGRNETGATMVSLHSFLLDSVLAASCERSIHHNRRYSISTPCRPRVGRR